MSKEPPPPKPPKLPPQRPRVSDADPKIGTRIRLRRLQMELSQGELGNKIGVTFQQVQKYEKGDNRVSASRLQKIADALEVPAAFFYEIDEQAQMVEGLLYVDAAFSLRLLRAYNSIADVPAKRQFVALMEAVAAAIAAGKTP